jgi:hypothetical protein
VKKRTASQHQSGAQQVEVLERVNQGKSSYSKVDLLAKDSLRMTHQRKRISSRINSKKYSAAQKMLYLQSDHSKNS